LGISVGLPQHCDEESTLLQRVLIAVLRFIARLREVREFGPADVRSVLVVELSRLGDVVSMLPVIHSLSKEFPNAIVHLLADRHFDSLLNSLDLDIKVHTVSISDSFWGMVRVLRTVRQIRADLSISISPPKRNALAVLASGSPYKVGYLKYTDSLTPYLLTIPVESFGFRLSQEVSYGRENIEDRASKICEALGSSTSNTRRQLSLKSDVQELMRAVSKERGIVLDGSYVVIHPFARWEYRTWDLSRFNALADRIVQSFGEDVVFVYSQDDAKRIEHYRILHEGNARVHFFSPASVLELAVVTKGASLFVGNDSGPLHLAAGLGVIVIGLFGPAEPDLTAPRLAKGGFLYKRVECSPCEQRVCVRKDDPCMGLISIDEVYEAVAHALSSEAVGAKVAQI
jgi:ADP-heptose:LPS heptosyltransferase